jgi:hypothetical protein
VSDDSEERSSFRTSEAQETPLHRRGDGTRIDHVVAEIGAVIDARHHQVRLIVEESRQREVHAIGRRTIDLVAILPVLLDPERGRQGQRIARSRTIPIRRDHDNVRDLRQCGGQRVDPGCEIPVIVTYKDFHYSSGGAKS